MSAAFRLRNLLEHHGVRYAVVTDSPAYAARDTEQQQRLPGREIAKVVVIRHAGTLSLAVLSARAQVDLERLSAALRDEVVLASEREITAVFTDCELGALPPFGSLYGLKTYVDESLTRDRQITFNAGSHTDAIRMAFEDYRRLAGPVILWLAHEPESNPAALAPKDRHRRV